jgi:hypothetical protein
MDDIDLELRWCYYYVVTEAFDRSVPHVMERHEAIVMPQFAAASTIHAKSWMQRLGLRLRDDFDQRRDVGCYTFAAQQERIEREWTTGWEWLPLHPDGGRFVRVTPQGVMR